MQFEWDERKSQANIKRRGLSFRRAVPVFEDADRIETVDHRQDYGEERLTTIGRSGHLVLFVAYTWRDGVCRIISTRKATKNERQFYYYNREVHS